MYNKLNPNDDYISLLTNSGFFTKADAVAFSDKFEDISLLSENEMAYCIVLKAKRHGKWHIIKRLKPQYANNPFYVQLIEKEFDIAYQLDHPHIAKVMDKDYDNNGMFIISEFVDGETLRSRMQRQDFKVDAQFVKRIIGQINDALAYIHSKQIVHRDLKPENILITHNGNNVKVIDFGLSDSDYHYLFKGAAGTRKYAAPEQLAENPSSSFKADYYSLGLILLELLTGVVDGGAAKSLKSPFKEIAQGCLNVDPDRRYGHEQVKHFLGHKASRNILVWTGCAALLVLIGYLFIRPILFVEAENLAVSDRTFDSVGIDKVEVENIPKPKALINEQSNDQVESAPTISSHVHDNLLENKIITESYEIGYSWIDSVIARVPDFNKIQDGSAIVQWNNVFKSLRPYQWVQLEEEYNIDRASDLYAKAEASFLKGMRAADSIYFKLLLNSQHYVYSGGSGDFNQLDMKEKMQHLMAYYAMLNKGMLLLQRDGMAAFTENAAKANDYGRKHIHAFRAD